jgi:hypothetical protein
MSDLDAIAGERGGADIFRVYEIRMLPNGSA